MRHHNGLRKLNRTSSHRLAMLRNMTNSLLRHEVIKTTLPKAKELRRVIEPMITLGKKPSLANRRLAFNRLRDRDMVGKLFGELVSGIKHVMAVTCVFLNSVFARGITRRWHWWNCWIDQSNYLRLQLEKPIRKHWL